jgi:hypothetical protein
LAIRQNHGGNWERHEHSCLTTRSPLLYPLPTPSYAAPKSGSSFCRTLYVWNPFGISQLYCIYTVRYMCLLLKHKFWAYYSPVLTGGQFHCSMSVAQWSQ